MKKRPPTFDTERRVEKKSEYPEFTEDLPNDLRDILENWDNSIGEWIRITEEFPELSGIMKSRAFIERCRWKGKLPLGKWYPAFEREIEFGPSQIGRPRDERYNPIDKVEHQTYLVSYKWMEDKDFAPKWRKEFLWIKHLELTVEIEAISLEERKKMSKYGFYWAAMQLQALRQLEYLDLTLVLKNDINEIESPCSPISGILYNPNPNDPFFSKLKTLIIRNIWNGRESHAWGPILNPSRRKKWTCFFCPSLEILEIYGMLENSKKTTHALVEHEIKFGFTHLKKLNVLCTNWYTFFMSGFYDIHGPIQMVDEIYYEGANMEKNTFLTTEFLQVRPYFPANTTQKITLLNLPTIRKLMVRTEVIEIQNTLITFDPDSEIGTIIYHGGNIDFNDAIVGTDVIENWDMTPLEPRMLLEAQQKLPPPKFKQIEKKPISGEFDLFFRRRRELSKFTKNMSDEDQLILENWDQTKDEWDKMVNNRPGMKEIITSKEFVSEQKWKMRLPTGKYYTSNKESFEPSKLKINKALLDITHLELALEMEVMSKEEYYEKEPHIYEIGLFLQNMENLRHLDITFVFTNKHIVKEPCLNFHCIILSQSSNQHFRNLETLILRNVFNGNELESHHAFSNLKHLELHGVTDLMSSPIRFVNDKFQVNFKSTMKLDYVGITLSPKFGYEYGKPLEVRDVKFLSIKSEYIMKPTPTVICYINIPHPYEIDIAVFTDSVISLMGQIYLVEFRGSARIAKINEAYGEDEDEFEDIATNQINTVKLTSTDPYWYRNEMHLNTLLDYHVKEIICNKKMLKDTVGQNKVKQIESTGVTITDIPKNEMTSPPKLQTVSYAQLHRPNMVNKFENNIPSNRYEQESSSVPKKSIKPNMSVKGKKSKSSELVSLLQFFE